MNEKYVFFLGGRDLEMLTISKILLKRNEIVHDKKLKWGAKASEYIKEIKNLPDDHFPVLIELKIDIEIPPNSIVIDHHNENAGIDKKTSIEQIADLLNIELTQEQKYVSINDKEHIIGLKKAGLDNKKIQIIRNQDRKAQGITSIDEKNAKVSIKHFSKQLSNDAIYINSFTEITSPITDFLFGHYKHIFIKTPQEKFSYSGTADIIEKLKKHYKENFFEDKEMEFWFGGELVNYGYFGSNRTLEIDDTFFKDNKFIEQRVISQHIFMFPFTIEFENKSVKSSKDRLKIIHDKIVSNNSKWEYAPFKINLIPNEIRNNIYSDNEIWAYNEYYYFHQSVRDSIFNETEENKLFNKKNSGCAVSLYYEYESTPKDEFVLFIKDKSKPANSKKFSLAINHISLRIFESNVGIFTLTLYNYTYRDLNEILKINDFGRRVSPQFMGIPYNLKTPTDITKDVFLPDKVKVKLGNHDFTEQFLTDDYFSNSNNYASYIKKLLEPLHEVSSNNEINLKIVPTIDDRMYVVCWHENSHEMGFLDKKSFFSYQYERSNSWYQYAFIDSGGPLVANEEMKTELINNVTYPRFVDYGTLFACTRYSLVCLCGIDPYNDYPYKQIRNHMQKMYYQIALLLLAQRTSIITFNNELEKISIDADKIFNSNNSYHAFEKIIERAESLNKDFVLFSNRIWFDEVTPQEQGIELYKLAQNNMDLISEFNSLRTKIEELHEFIRLKLEERKNKRIFHLTRLGTYLALVVISLTFFTIDTPNTEYWRKGIYLKDHLSVPFWGILFFISSIFFFPTTIYLIFFREKKSKWNWLILFLIVLMLVDILFAVF